eukprot:2909495-Rhodomonas_salina.1
MAPCVKHSFGGLFLHNTRARITNPYQQTTGSTFCFPFQQDGRASHGFKEVLERYNLAGPTNFAPVIRKTIETVKEERVYHILGIIADGQISHCCQEETKRPIVEASKYPTSIVVIGVGNRPWGQMDEFEDELPQRKFDNFKFVPSVPAGRNVDAAFACAVLPAQQAAQLPQLALFYFRLRLAITFQSARSSNAGPPPSHARSGWLLSFVPIGVSTSLQRRSPSILQPLLYCALELRMKLLPAERFNRWPQPDLVSASQWHALGACLWACSAGRRQTEATTERIC